jgi:hypothetical protein
MPLTNTAIMIVASKLLLRSVIRLESYHLLTKRKNYSIFSKLDLLFILTVSYLVLRVFSSPIQRTKLTKQLLLGQCACTSEFGLSLLFICARGVLTRQWESVVEILRLHVQVQVLHTVIFTLVNSVIQSMV